MPLGPANISAMQAASFGLEIDMDPSAIIMIASFDKLGLDIRSFRVPLERSVREVMAPSLRQNFFEQGRPDQWQELAEQTVYTKELLGYSATAPFPLVRTGKLRTVAGQINLWVIDGIEGTATVELPETVWYGRVHQEGGSSGGIGSIERRRSRLTGQIKEIERGVPGYVPQRIWAIIQDRDIDAIEEVFDKWLEERLLGNVFLR